MEKILNGNARLRRAVLGSGFLVQGWIPFSTLNSELRTRNLHSYPNRYFVTYSSACPIAFRNDATATLNPW